jgi:hypothetical protein
MENLRRVGGEAGVLAGMATALLFVGLVWFFPQAGLPLADQTNPHKYIAFITKHQVLFWLVNVLGGLLAALMSAVLFLALGDRFGDEAPASARIGPLFGIGGAMGFAAAALIRQVGFSAAAAIYRGNQAGAVNMFRGLQAVEMSMFALGQVAIGLGAIVLGIVMLRARNYAGVGYLSAVAGTTMFLGGFIPHVVLFVASFALMTMWLVWSALVLRAEAGPAFVRWGARSRAPERKAA